jgi:hypothetical protein
MGSCDREESSDREALDPPPVLAGVAAAALSRAEILSAHVGASEADRNPLAPSDLELDRGPMPRRTSTIDAAAPDSFARLVIGVIIETFDEAAGVGRDCRFPFGAAPEQSNDHRQPPLNQ